MSRRHHAHRATRPHTGRWWSATAVALAMVTGALVLLGHRGADATDSSVQSAPIVAREVSREVPLRSQTPPRRRTAEAATRPEHVSIPAIGVSTQLVDLGLNDDNTVEVPQVAAQAGWFDQGPVPGEVGSSVVLGHVDSQEGPAVFYRLSELDPGDRVVVRLSDGAIATFAVVRVVAYDNDRFPAQRVYAGSTRRPTLNLVTCGGEYDPERGGYQARVVVYTEHVDASAARASAYESALHVPHLGDPPFPS